MTILFRAEAGSVPLFLTAQSILLGGKAYTRWQPDLAPHVLLFGGTGSGKTYAAQVFLAHLAQAEPKAQAIICDFKGDDSFSFLQGRDRYFQFSACEKGLNLAYEKLTERQNGDKNRSFWLLVFDEFASFLNTAEKKQGEAYRLKMSTLLMLGRSFNIHVLVSQQRPDAQYFATARDNFGLVIALGNISTEATQMFFSDFKDRFSSKNSRGFGYQMTNGMDFQRIVVPTIQSTAKMELALVGLVSH